MKKFLIGAAAAALTVSAAAPAQAQYRDYDRRGGIDAGDIVTGVAVLGGIAAVLGALDRDGGRYGYDNRGRYRDGYSQAVNSCGYEAERYGRGQVRITDVDRRSNGRYRVEGVVEGGGYDPRYDRRYDRRNDARDYRDGYGERFTCTAYENGRIAEFRMRNGYASRY
jgi:opacity protein-like surface antigen